MKDANIFYQQDKNAVLVFPDGTCFYGYGIGKKAIAKGEICFNTSIVGYQEILTDPSYSGQIITFTFPHIGNVGTNSKDIESNSVKACGLIVREPITNPSSYRSQSHLNEWLKENSLTGICGVDTRQITNLIRTKGAKVVAIIYSDKIEKELIKKVTNEIGKTPNLEGKELAYDASQNKEYSWKKEGGWIQSKNSYNSVATQKFKVVAIDYGAKLNILRCLTEVGCDVKVVSAKSTFKDIIKHSPDGVFLSNGPGDPLETYKYTGSVICEVLKNKIPLFGICLGHQLLSLALGAKTSKMYQGHRGVNQPVQDLDSKRVEITSQNHGFCVDRESITQNVKVTHVSLFDRTVEGIKLKDGPAFSVQYHPESSSGPHDSFYLFEQFIKMMEESRK